MIHQKILRIKMYFCLHNMTIDIPNDPALSKCDDLQISKSC